MTHAAVSGGGRPTAGDVHPVDGHEVAVPAPGRGWRAAIRSRPGLGQAWRLGVFVLGGGLVVLGLVLTVLPGPLTIPPVLLGLWLWSTEFSWAHRLFARFQDKARMTWAHARLHPVSCTVVTVAGLTAAAAVAWTAWHFQLVHQVTAWVGL